MDQLQNKTMPIKGKFLLFRIIISNFNYVKTKKTSVYL